MEAPLLEKSSSSQEALPNVITVLKELLKAITITKHRLEAECEEAESLLRQWEIPDNNYCENDFTSLAAPDSEITDEPLTEDITNGISQAIDYARSVREKVSPQKSVPKVNRLVNSNQSKAIGNQIKKSQSKKTVAPVVVNKTRQKIQPSNVICTTYQKDFAPVKSKINQTVPRAFHESSTQSRELNILSTKFNFRDLDDVLSMVTANTRHSPSTDSLRKQRQAKNISANDSKVKCVVSEMSMKRITSVSLAEGVDVLGLPPEVVKVLRLYHKFVCRETTDGVKEKKYKDDFINQLHATNAAQFEANAARDPDMCQQLSKYMAIFRQMSHVEEAPTSCRKKFGRCQDILRGVCPDMDCGALRRYSSLSEWHEWECLEASIHFAETHICLLDALLHDLSGRIWEPHDLALVYKAVDTLRDLGRLRSPILISCPETPP